MLLLMNGRHRHSWWKVSRVLHKEHVLLMRLVAAWVMPLAVLWAVFALARCVRLPPQLEGCTHALLWGWHAADDGWAASPLLVEGKVVVVRIYAIFVYMLIDRRRPADALVATLLMPRSAVECRRAVGAACCC
jgi:hypothetical protein